MRTVHGSVFTAWKRSRQCGCSSLVERPYNLRYGGGSADLVRMSAGSVSDRDKATACLLSMLCGSGLRFNRIPKQFMPRGSSGRSRGNFGGSSLPAGVSIYWLLRCPFHQNKTTFPAVLPCRQLSHSLARQGTCQIVMQVWKISNLGSVHASFKNLKFRVPCLTDTGFENLKFRFSCPYFRKSQIYSSLTEIFQKSQIQVLPHALDTFETRSSQKYFLKCYFHY